MRREGMGSDCLWVRSFFWAEESVLELDGCTTCENTKSHVMLKIT